MYIHVCILAHRCAFSSAGPLLPLALVAFHVSALQWHVMRPSNVYTCVHFGAPVRFSGPLRLPAPFSAGSIMRARNVYTCVHFGAPVRFSGPRRLPAPPPLQPRNVYTCMHFGAPVRFFSLRASSGQVPGNRLDPIYMYAFWRTGALFRSP